MTESFQVDERPIEEIKRVSDTIYKAWKTETPIPWNSLPPPPPRKVRPETKRVVASPTVVRTLFPERTNRLEVLVEVATSEMTRGLKRTRDDDDKGPLKKRFRFNQKL